jgi:nicotinamidase-related amidase
MPNAVIVTDMLKCFMEPGHDLYVGDHARDIIPHVQKVLEAERGRGSTLFFICDHHLPVDPEFKMFPPHCVAGSEEAQVIAELAGYEGQIIPKRRYSGFFGTDLDARLHLVRPEKLIICGVLTNICVMHTTADARNNYYPVEVPVDCVATTDEQTQQFALNHIEKVLGATLTVSGDYR